MKKILFITESPYPSNTAMSVRYHALAKLFQYCGCEVLVLTRGKDNGRKISYFDGVAYLSVSSGRNHKLNRVIDYMYSIPKYIKKITKKEDFDGFLLLSYSDRVLKILKQKQRKEGINLLFDAVEWYSASQFSKGEKARQYKQKDRLITKEIDDKFKVISISSYLNDYFNGKGINSIRVPVIMDMEKVSYDKNLNREKLVISYAGAPGKKDYLKEVVEGCAMLSKEELTKIELRLIGIQKPQLVSSCGASEQSVNLLGESLICYGRRPREFVQKTLEESNFTILLRPSGERYAKAGFPTKVVESLSSGTPIIGNLTSDLALYIKDLENGIVVSDCSAKAVCDAVKRALSTDAVARKKMCETARQTAENNFDYRLYAKDMIDFLKA